jgi:hypothetical protein
MKKLFFTFLFFFVAFIISLIIIPYFVPTDAPRNFIQREVSQKLKAQVVIDDFRLRFFPSPGYTIKGFRLVSEDPPFQGLDIFVAERLEGTLSIGALLGRAVTTEVKAYGVRVDVRSDEGANNLAMLFGLRSDSTAAPAAPVPADGTIVLPPREGAPTPGPEGVQPPPPEVPADSIKSMPAEPEKNGGNSSSLDGLPVREANAAQESPSHGPRLSISSFYVMDGQVNIYKGNTATPFVLKNLELAASNISYEEDPSAMGFQGVIGLDLRAGFAMFGSTASNASVAGRIMYDGARQEFSARGLRAFLLGAQGSLDLVAGFGFSPVTFDLHIATPAMSPTMLLDAYPARLKSIISEMGWQGQVSLDLTAKGNLETYGVDIVLDASSSSFRFMDVLSKGAGSELKCTAKLAVGKESISADSIGLAMGEKAMSLKGYLKKDDFLSYHLEAAADGLDDTTIKPLFPGFVLMDSFEDLKFDAAMDGAISPGGPPSQARGTISAKKAQVAGVIIDELDAAFSREGDNYIAPTVKGKFVGGAMSGNGTLTGGDAHEYKFDGVVDDVDIAMIASARGLARGNSSLVIHASTSGKDALSVSNNLQITGSVVSPSGSFPNVNIAKQALSADTWKALEALGGAALDEVEKTKLSDVNADFSSLNTAYEMTATGLKISGLMWSNPTYSAQGFTVKMAVQKTPTPSAPQAAGAGGPYEIEADGNVVLPKGVAIALVKDKTAQGNLLDDKQELSLPMIIKGNAAALDVKLDQVKLAKVVGEKQAASAPPQGEPAKVIRNDAAGGAGPQAGAPPKPQTGAPQKPQGQRSSGATKEEPKKPTDEMLKVIIGE